MLLLLQLNLHLSLFFIVRLLLAQFSVLSSGSPGTRFFFACAAPLRRVGTPSCRNSGARLHGPDRTVHSRLAPPDHCWGRVPDTMTTAITSATPTNTTTTATDLRGAARVPWPLPAVVAWCSGWLAWRLTEALGGGPAWALAAGCAASALLAWPCNGLWRRGLAALGFPLLAWWAGAAQGLAAAWWLLPLLPLSLVYPLRAWRDAPLFPTPAAGLQGLPEIVGQPHHVLDAGCGLGHGLRALAALWPQARLQGVEWSPLLTAGARLMAPAARIRRGDMWSRSWAPFDLVYVFQRPESMARAWEKAQRELKPGAWLVSLEFAVPGIEPLASLAGPHRRTVWIYRL